MTTVSNVSLFGISAGEHLIRWFAFCFLGVCYSSASSGDYRFETSDFLKQTAYGRPSRVATDIDESGAESTVNMLWDRDHIGKWFIEQQRYGGDAIDAGVAKDDVAAIDRGLKILRWGFEHQESDGSFNCPDSFHSMSFFIESAAHACLILRESPYAEKYAQEIDWMKPRLLKAAHWMTEPAKEEMGRRGNAPYTHRRYLVAAALGEVGVLCDDSALLDKSKEYVREGIGLQESSGINPEKNGYDTSYQAVGLFYAERYYDWVADTQTKSELLSMLQKGNDWLKNRINQDGTIDTSGNTRTGEGQELSRNGIPKTINYGIVYRGFYHWYLISGDSSYQELAERVHKGEDIYKHQLGKS
jgi:hypothetical protein